MTDYPELLARLRQHYHFGRFADDFNRPLAKTIRADLRQLCEQIPAIRSLEAQLEQERKAREEAERDAEQTARCWQREICVDGMLYRPKSHFIDFMVLATQKVMALAKENGVKCCGTPEYCTNHNCNNLLRYRLKRAEAAEQRLTNTLMYVASMAKDLANPIYNDPENRSGLIEDCKAVAGKRINLDYLTVAWQTQRAIRAEKRLAEVERETVEKCAKIVADAAPGFCGGKAETVLYTIADTILALIAPAEQNAAAPSEQDAMRRDAERWRISLKLGMFPARMGSPLYIDGGYVKWTINGDYYGLTENECADAAIDAEIARRKGKGE